MYYKPNSLDHMWLNPECIIWIVLWKPLQEETNQTNMSCDSFGLQEKKIILAVDASDVDVGAVLLQEGKDKMDLPIYYISKMLGIYQNKVFPNWRRMSLKHVDAYVGSMHYWSQSHHIY